MVCQIEILVQTKLERILYIYSLYVNIRQGVKSGRIPKDVLSMDILELVKLAIQTRDFIPPTASMEWAVTTFCTGRNDITKTMIHQRPDPITMINMVLGHCSPTLTTCVEVDATQTTLTTFMVPRSVVGYSAYRNVSIVTNESDPMLSTEEEAFYQAFTRNSLH